MLIVAVRNSSNIILYSLIKQFGDGMLSYFELWMEIEEAFKLDAA